MKKTRLLYIVGLLALMLAACGGKQTLTEGQAQATEEVAGEAAGTEAVENEPSDDTGAETEGIADSVTDETESTENLSEGTETASGKTDSDGTSTAGDTEADSGESATVPGEEILQFVDVFGAQYETVINPAVAKHTYDKSLFTFDGQQLHYEDENYRSRLGIDVSHHNGEIDWKKVKDAGYEFAILRIGYRGYGSAGNICEDRQFYNNLKNAQANGIEVGVYFFAQAINEEEAREEAEFVLGMLDGAELQLPVVYDPESILDADARTDNVSGEQFTKNTMVFCEMMKEAGYEPMIYSNMLWEAYQFDLEQLSAYPIWYADYEPQPQTPYHFEFWQYSNTGKVDGVPGDADLDIQLIRK